MWRQTVQLIFILCAVVFLGPWPAAARAQSAQPIATVDSQSVPITWIDADTGHRITRLTNEPGSRSLYFNQNAFLPDGKQMIYLTNTNI